ncbi:MAG: hypothetical protein ACRELC_12780 [Gemmatimonadota bacterium]
MLLLLIVECLFAAMASYALEKHAIRPVTTAREGVAGAEGARR